VDEKHPVIVLVQAWAERYMTLEDWKADNDDGHYVIVIGHHGGIIVFEDPSSFHRTWMTEEEFLARWHDVDPRTQQRLEHFGMVLLGKEPVPPHKTFEHMD
jgi:predicted double-glycine peptidase